MTFLRRAQAFRLEDFEKSGSIFLSGIFEDFYSERRIILLVFKSSAIHAVIHWKPRDYRMT